jgi:hypothetical protein
VAVADAFAEIAASFSAAGLGAFYDAAAKWPGSATYDEGGSIETPGTPVEKTCQVQVDAVTDAMRAEGYVDGDMRLLVLAATLDGSLDTEAVIEVDAGPHAGQWMIASVTRDPCGVYWECRGRKRRIGAADS